MKALETPNLRIGKALIIIGGTALLSAAQAETIPRIPDGQDAWVSATLKKVDLKSRTCELSLESVRLLDGTETHYNTSPKQNVTIPLTTRIAHYNSPHRWLRLDQVTPNASVSLTVHNDPARPDVWQGRSMVINVPDPLQPNLAAPIPTGSHPFEADKVTLEPLTVPMVFPVAGKHRWSDTFLAARGGGTRRHRGQDIFADKLAPLVACFDGIVEIKTGGGNAGYMITLIGDNGWTAQYYHVNNDTPGTDDGKGGPDYAFAPGIKNGTRVYAGQLIGYNGDSGNAESTSPHVHFELWNRSLNACFNPVESLNKAKKLDQPALYLPFPEVAAGQGMIRIDGHVRSLNLLKNEFTLDLLSEREGDKPLAPKTKPEQRVVRAPDSPRFLLFETGEVVPLSQLRPNDRIAVFVESKPTNGAHDLARAWVLPNPQAPRTFDTTALTDSSDSMAFKTETDVIQAFKRGSATTHADQLLADINAFRQSKNLPHLKVSAQLCNAALAHSIAMRDGDFFDAIDLRTGLTASDLATHSGFPARSHARVYSASSLDKLKDQIYKDSAYLLTDPKLKFVGIGYATLPVDPGKVNVKHYWTVLVGR